LEKTPEVKIGSRGKLKTRNVQKEPTLVSTPQPPRVKTRSVQKEKTSIPAPQSPRVKMKKVQKNQNSRVYTSVL
jgi:hypothetical protein